MKILENIILYVNMYFSKLKKINLLYKTKITLPRLGRPKIKGCKTPQVLCAIYGQRLYVQIFSWVLITLTSFAKFGLGILYLTCVIC
jgi:hypothetical protein